MCPKIDLLIVFAVKVIYLDSPILLLSSPVTSFRILDTGSKTENPLSLFLFHFEPVRTLHIHLLKYPVIPFS